jgi:hypothetical protein
MAVTRTVTVIEQEITTINAAIAEILSGNKLKVLRVGSGDFARLYQEHDLNLTELYKIRQSLYDELAVADNTPKSFNLGGFVPMVGRK